MTDDSKLQGAGTADKVKLAAAILLVIAGLVLAAVVVALSRYGSEFRRFLELARIELRKVVWPTRQETLQTTLVVFGFVIIAGIFFWLLDLALAWATKALTGTGG